MKKLRSFFAWGSLYVLIGIFLGLLFWEERLNIQPVNHTILATGILIGFGYVCVRWVASHATNFLDTPFDEHFSHGQDEESKQQRAHLEQ